MSQSRDTLKTGQTGTTPTTDVRAQIRRVIDQALVRTVFQPVIDSQDGLIVAYEALTRPSADSGFSTPDELFHAAHTAGLLWELEELTRATAFATAVDWPRDVKLFINSSPSVFGDPRFANSLARQVSASAGLTPARVVLEITEHAETADDASLVDQVDRARRLGFQVAVDDAGAGTSGLNRIMVLRPQWIKLDRQFCRDVHRDGLKQNLVRFFVHFARNSGVNVVAEGVESADELAALIAIGVRYTQGYFFARPGDRALTTDPTFAAEIREKWASVEASVPETPRDLPLARLCRPLLVLQDAAITCGEALAQVARLPGHLGVVLKPERAIVGWIDVERLSAACVQNPERALSTIVTRADPTLSPEATVPDAVNAICARDQAHLGEPVLIASGSEVVGGIRTKDLLIAIAAEHRPASSLRAPLTGLPTRVRADQHLEEMIGRSCDPLLRQSSVYHADVAFIDVRSFGELNALLGYDTGDRLIRTLGERLQQVVVQGESRVFVAHLRDDRFMLTAPAGVLHPRLRALIDSYDPREPDADRFPGLDGRALGLRVLLMPDVFQAVRHPREVYRLEQLLRQRARDQERSLPVDRSILLQLESGSAASTRLVA